MELGHDNVNVQCHNDTQLRSDPDGDHHKLIYESCN